MEIPPSETIPLPLKTYHASKVEKFMLLNPNVIARIPLPIWPRIYRFDHFSSIVMDGT